MLRLRPRPAAIIPSYAFYNVNKTEIQYAKQHTTCRYPCRQRQEIILRPSGQRSRAQRLGRECLSAEECRQGEEQSLQLLSQESQLRDSQGWKDCPSWFQSHSTP